MWSVTLHIRVYIYIYAEVYLAIGKERLLPSLVHYIRAPRCIQCWLDMIEIDLYLWWTWYQPS